MDEGLIASIDSLTLKDSVKTKLGMPQGGSGTAKAAGAAPGGGSRAARRRERPSRGRLSSSPRGHRRRSPPPSSRPREISGVFSKHRQSHSDVCGGSGINNNMRSDHGGQRTTY